MFYTIYKKKSMLKSIINNNHRSTTEQCENPPYCMTASSTDGSDIHRPLTWNLVDSR